MPRRPMFKETDPQGDLFALSNQLPENVREKLKDSWAHGFATKVMPILLDVEGQFAGIYDENTGRPAWSVARKLGICLLQAWFDYDDQEALDELSYDIRWQYALGLPPEEAYLSRRSLVQFRSDLVEFDPEMEFVEEVFRRITDEALEDLEIEVDHQRMDSTQIVSNIQSRGRVWLFGETLIKFLRQLRDERPEQFEKVPNPIEEWMTKRLEGEGWFGQGNDQHASIEQLAEWLVWAKRHFESVDEVTSWESYQLVARLVDEHCEIEEGSEQSSSGEGQTVQTAMGGDEIRVELRDAPKNGGASMQTPHDPDATFGDKGLGYKVHLVETCGNGEADCELLTGYKVTGADDNDWGTSIGLYETLEEAGWVPEVMFADAGYPTAESLVDANDRGSRLHAPVAKKGLPDDYVGREAFAFDEEGCLEQCPEGKSPVKHTRRKRGNRDEPLLHAVFEASDCEACPLQGKCPARHSHADQWYVPLGERLRRRDEALAAQHRESWWDAYRIRSGIEATVAELKDPHGMEKLRVRGRRKVELVVGLKVTACNVKRWLNHTEVETSDESAPLFSAFDGRGSTSPLRGGIWRLDDGHLAPFQPGLTSSPIRSSTPSPATIGTDRR